MDGDEHHRLLAISGADLDVTLSGLSLTHGRASLGGALAIDDAGGTVTLKKSKISGNTASGTDAVGQPGDLDYVARGPGYGGGIYDPNAALLIEGSSLSANTAQGGDYIAFGRGGGIFAGATATVTVQGSKITGNIAKGQDGAAGGGICCGVGELTTPRSRALPEIRPMARCPRGRYRRRTAFQRHRD